ncbi:hypothetical protein [Neisseria sp. Ec49-e6-T10]|uniref:hypothetical protein n=1 Tax=Neisseria sp. Ec49-e6-T10 TaxID=3140744 RepID=UPI003EB9191A
MVSRKKATVIHLLVSAVIAIATGLAFRFIYFPDYYFDVLDGTHKFFLIIGVDVVLGPLLTFIIFNPKKPKKELTRDVSLIAVIQIAALAYGLYASSFARPVYTVFEGKTLTIITANELQPNMLKRAQAPYNALPIFGPKNVFSKKPTEKSLIEDITLGSGFGQGQPFWPELYTPLTDEHKKQMWQAAEPVNALEPALTQEQLAWVQKSFGSDSGLKALPTSSQMAQNPYFWAIISPEGNILAVLPVNPDNMDK